MGFKDPRDRHGSPNRIGNDEILPFNLFGIQIGDALERYDSEFLLIYDNAEEVIPFPNKGRFIVTTQKGSYFQEKDLIQVLPLSPTEAVALQREILGAKSAEVDPKLLEAIAEELDFLPVNLAQAAAYINNTPTITVEEYVQLLKSGTGTSPKKYAW